MEKVLRKVSVKDRNPKDGTYFTNCGENTYSQTTWLDTRNSNLQYPGDDITQYVEYWYEEVSPKDLLQEYSKELEAILGNLAKERYEKALSFVLNSRDMTRMPRQILNEEMYKALRIAAGLEDEV